MWVFIVLLLIGGTIIVARIFRNGAREGLAETEPGAAFAPVTTPGELPVRTASATTSAPVSSKASEPASAETSPAEPEPASPYPPAVSEQAGGPCPSCGTDTVPGAKFCGECGTRLVS
jgi:hypothetical protein